jgi:hypothetical protein
MKNIGRLVAGFALLGTLSLSACGGAGGLGNLAGGAVPKEDTGKPLIEEARGYIAELQGEYVLAMGVIDEAQALVEDLAQIPGDVNLKQLKLKELTSALEECWSTPVTKATDAAEAAVDLKDAATHFDKKEGLRSLNQTQTALKAAYKNVNSCAPASLAKAKALPGNANEMTKNFVDLKVKQVDQLRILIQQEAPARGERLFKAAAGIVPKIAEIAVKLEAQAKNPLTDQGLFKGHQAEFTKLQGDLQAMVSRIQGDAKDMSNKVSTMPAKVAKSFAFKK